MEESGIYSIVLGLISIGSSIYFIEDLTIRIGLITLITIILILLYLRDYINQINKNTRGIDNRLNKIENEIKILKEVKK